MVLAFGPGSAGPAEGRGFPRAGARQLDRLRDLRCRGMVSALLVVAALVGGGHDTMTTGESLAEDR
jgi:hypothetical protein